MQRNTPAWLIETLAPDQLPGARTIVPRSRSWTRDSDKGLVALALTFTTAFAASASDAGAVSAKSSAMKRTQLIMQAPH